MPRLPDSLPPPVPHTPLSLPLCTGQNTRSPYQFASIGSMSPTLWVARGYAVLDGPTLPIVAEGEEEPNDTFLPQLVDGAKAAIDECVRRGVVDPTRVSAGGHRCVCSGSQGMRMFGGKGASSAKAGSQWRVCVEGDRRSHTRVCRRA